MNPMVPLDYGDILPDKNYGHLRVSQRSLTWAMMSLTIQRWLGEKDKKEVQEGLFEITLLGLSSWDCYKNNHYH
jgi:hypothetical protein